VIGGEIDADGVESRQLTKGFDMKVVAFAVSFALFGAACSQGSPDHGGPDAGAGGSRVTIRTGEPPALIAFRDEAATEWKTPAATGTGMFEIEVAGPYRVVVVCEASSRFTFVAQYLRTPADERVIEHLCGPEPTFPFHVRGQMLQEGEVFLGSFGVGRSPGPWMFDLRAVAGTFDFVAFFGSLTTGFDQVAIRRDMAVTGDLDLGTIDAAQEHALALVSAQLTAPNLDPDEMLSSHVFAHLGNTSISTMAFDQPATAWNVRLLPDAALRPTESQDVDLAATISTLTEPRRQRIRSIDRRVQAGGQTSFMLMEPLGSIAFETTADRLVATWAALPSYDELDLSRESFSNDFSRFLIHDLVLSRAFVDTVGATRATLDVTDVPGFRPEWRHDPTLEQVIELDASAATSPDGHVRSGVSEDVPLAPTAGQRFTPPRMNPQHALELAQQHRMLARHGRLPLPRP
jgi:hypothetical protein